MEAIERLQERELAKFDPSVAEPTIVSTEADLRRVVAEFAPGHRDNRHQDPVQIAANMPTIDDKGQNSTFRVTAVTQSKSRREMIIDAINMVHNRCQAIEEHQLKPDQCIEINGKTMMPVQPVADEMELSIDPLIRHWMGGARKGEFIYWHLSDNYTYKYDIREHRLIRYKEDAPTN